MKKSLLTAKSASVSPSRNSVNAAEMTDAITIGVNVRSEKSRSRISSTKKMPAIGALNTDEMPAAAPQPSSVAVFCGLVPSQRPKFDPIAAPMVTIGPSAPAEPPEPIVAVAASHLRAATRIGIAALSRWMAYMTAETPGPVTYRAM